jgi:hypothetical protein
MDYSIELPVSVEFQSYEGVVFVYQDSIASHKIALGSMASYFKKEFHYDYLQYCEEEHDPDCIGVLFVERAYDKVENIDHHPHRVVGGACFRKRTEIFVLDWVWLHPFARNRKILKNNWANFKSRFDEFEVSTPLSAHMESFLKKINNNNIFKG